MKRIADHQPPDRLPVRSISPKTVVHFSAFQKGAEAAQQAAETACNNGENIMHTSYYTGYAITILASDKAFYEFLKDTPLHVIKIDRQERTVRWSF